MAMGRPKAKLTLSEGQRQQLESLASSRSPYGQNIHPHQAEVDDWP